MTDKLENKRSKRQEKSIRDKKKEVEFLKKAVEQGVVEQLDLDAAQEELDDMLSPMSQKEKDILTLQKEIAEANKALGVTTVALFMFFIICFPKRGVRSYSHF